MQHLLGEFADEISSDSFASRARHAEHPNAFTRTRALPLPALVAALLARSRSPSPQRPSKMNPRRHVDTGGAAD